MKSEVQFVYIMSLIVLGVALVIMGVICDRLRSRCRTTYREYFTVRRECEKQTQDQLISLIDDLYEFYDNQDASQDKMDGVDSARAVIEFYFDQTTQGKRAKLVDLLERSKPRDEK